MRLPPTLLVVVLLALLGGCGGSSEETTTSPQNDRGDASRQEVRSAWEQKLACRRPAGASRWGCTVGSYRCQGVVTGRGLSISCSRPGHSIAFTVPRN